MSMSPAVYIASDDDGDIDHYGPDLFRTDDAWRDYLYAVHYLKESVLLQNIHDGKPLQGIVAIAEELTNDPKKRAAEVEELLWKQIHPQRYERMDDILEESIDYTPRFLYSCGIDPLVHRNTHRLIETMSLVAYLVVMPFKNYFKRPRPSQVEVDIEPAILIPAHYSFPSGHSTQAHLIKNVLIDLIGKRIVGLEERIKFEAEEVARNREWGGVHYASDTDAGKLLADAVWSEMKKLYSLSRPAAKENVDSKRPRRYAPGQDGELSRLYWAAAAEWEEVTDRAPYEWSAPG
ncbi:MAG: phosphatase PAP2 family protein, partial [Pseudomonadota bacterium]